MASESSPPAAVAEPELARLAASQLRRVRSIVDAAVALAEQGGEEAVRLRDVSEASGVALGTLYKYFRSKEDILLHAVNQELLAFERTLAERPPEGTTPRARVVDFFARASRGLTGRPLFARATLRAVAAGAPETAEKVAGFHLRTTRMIVAALRGTAPRPEQPLSETVGDEAERRIALVLEHVWFSVLVGWAGGLHPLGQIDALLEDATRLLLEGVATR